ncbi:hypothetical protein KGY73_09535 [bacterium]|nr:hypothetical protein [bacterium]
MKGTSHCRKVKTHLIEIAEQKTDQIPNRNELLSHISSCPECSRLVKHFSRLWSELEPPREREPSSDFLNGIIQKIEEHEHRKISFKTVFGELKPFLRAVPLAALIVLGVFTGKYLGDTQPQMETQSYSQLISEYSNGFEEIPSGSFAEVYLNLNSDEEEGNS